VDVVAVKDPADEFLACSGPARAVKIKVPGCATVLRCTEGGVAGNKDAVGGKCNDERELALIPAGADVETESIEIPAYVSDGCISTGLALAEPGGN
jgi:hypothetical protein